MKIVFIGQKGIPAKFGGVERHVSDLAVRLVELGNEVIVYTRTNYTDKNLKEYRGVNLVSLPNIKTKNLDAISHTFFACLDVIFKRKNVDIIHFHSIGPSSLIWLIRLFKPRTPVISTFHTQCYFHKKWSMFAKAYLKFGEYIACKFSSNLIVVSKTLKKYVKEKYGREAINIPNGVNIPEFKKAEQITKKWGLEKDSYILSVSRLVKHKGIHYLIDAYKRIETDKKLVIVGGGFFTDKYVSEIHKLAENEKNIIFTGEQNGDLLEELFSNALLSVHPSESEGLSIALLEAMSYKLGVLVSDIPENMEVVEDKGFVFENKNVEDLAKKLHYLTNNPDMLKNRGLKALEHVKKDYSWDTITADIVKVYNK